MSISPFAVELMAAMRYQALVDLPRTDVLGVPVKFFWGIKQPGKKIYSRNSQKPVGVTPCRFDPGLRHQILMNAGFQ
jgi:hypothetical protein